MPDSQTDLAWKIIGPCQDSLVMFVAQMCFGTSVIIKQNYEQDKIERINFAEYKLNLTKMISVFDKAEHITSFPHNDFKSLLFQGC